jgi:precorrin-3B methylase
LLLACVVVDCIMAPPHAVVALGAGAASMGAALAVNLAVISLVEILGVALTEEDE